MKKRIKNDTQWLDPKNPTVEHLGNVYWKINGEWETTSPNGKMGHSLWGVNKGSDLEKTLNEKQKKLLDEAPGNKGT